MIDCLRNLHLSKAKASEPEFYFFGVEAVYFNPAHFLVNWAIAHDFSEFILEFLEIASDISYNSLLNIAALLEFRVNWQIFSVRSLNGEWEGLASIHRAKWCV